MTPPLSEEDVQLAYQLLLGREPESDKVARQHLRHGTRIELGQALMRSNEFRSKMLSRVFPTGAKWVAVDVMDRFVQWINLCDHYVSAGCLQNRWDGSGTKFFASRLGAGDTVLDIGANVGWFTLVAAKQVGKNGCIHSFEPMPQTARMLRRTVADNDLQRQITVWDYALSDAWGKLDLVQDEGGNNPGSASIYKPMETRPDRTEAVRIATAPLDDLLPDLAPDVVKIDIEGAEPLALQGARKVLARKRPVIVSELFPAQLQRVSGRTPAQYIGQMAEMGYGCYLLEDGKPGQRLTDFPADTREKSVNVVFERTGPGKL